MKKVFIVTGEPSGDKLASKVIRELKKSRNDVEYLSVGGENLKNLGIKSIFELNEITYIGFTSVIFNIFKIKKKINETASAIIDFKPDILFTVDTIDSIACANRNRPVENRKLTLESWNIFLSF